LIPVMKLRIASPGALVDINRIEGLDRLEQENGHLVIRALVRHRTCERPELLRGRYGGLGAAAPLISDPIVRNRGTVCGSLAHAAEAETALAGAEPTEDAIREAARLAAEAADPVSDHRGSADYKRNVVRIFTERGLRTAVEAARAA